MMRSVAAVVAVVVLTAAVAAAAPCRLDAGARRFDLTGLRRGVYPMRNATAAPALALRGICGDLAFALVGCPAAVDQICELHVRPVTARDVHDAAAARWEVAEDADAPTLVFEDAHGAALRLRFACDVGARIGLPEFERVDGATYAVRWPSMFGCAREATDGRQSNVDLLIDLALSESLAYDRLAEMTRMFGHRLSGSSALERSIDWVLDHMDKEDKIDAVYTEPVTVPTWIRGNEYARIIAPRTTNMSILGLGLSNGTGPNGVRGEIIVVESFEELADRAAEVPGKIVLHNAPYVSYGANSNFRRLGAVEAEKYGAVASLVRSIAPFSLYTPHTGSMQTAGIPGAAVTHEDADLIASWIAAGDKVEVFLYMEAHFDPDSISRNIIAEVKGTTYPDEVVVMGGHIDSWDVGTGALDDGGGAFVAWDALRLMAKYDIRPKRTVRVVFWTNEENGANGARVYKENREEELPRVSWAFESDSGVFSPIGIGFSGSNAAYTIMSDIGQTYLARIGAGTVTRGGGGVDIDPMCQEGVPCAGLTVATGGRADKLDSYFFYHHTNADTITAVNANELALCTASMAAWAYAVADLDTLLPR